MYFSVLAGNKQFFCCGGKILLRPKKKKNLVVCLAGSAVVSVFGSGRKLAVFLLWRESFITTGKKKFQSSGDYDRKKKVLVVCLAGCAVVLLFGSGRK